MRIGEGRISATISVGLGILSVLGVLCFRFPDLLTTPRLREAYDVDAMRWLLLAGMGLSATFGAVTFALGRQTRLGALGILIALTALWLGGVWVQPGPRYGSAAYLGLDWFILDLLLSAAIFVPLERLFPRDPGQGLFRRDWALDLRYFVVNHLMVGVFLYATTVAAPTVFAWAVHPGTQAFVRSLPRAVQFAIAIVAADLMEYALHRALHEVKWLWPIHAVHHSVPRMDWLAGSRLHLLEPLVTRVMVLLPSFVLGIEQEVVAAYIVVAGFHAGIIHANVDIPWGWLRHVVNTPRYHHWHHASDREAIDTNYVGHFPWIDRLFGTHHFPADRWPTRYGVVGTPLPRGVLRQFAHPFAAPWRKAAPGADPTG